MIAAPQPTIEKPLTVIDYIAVLEQCRSVGDVADYSEQLPTEILHDERYTRAVAGRLAAIHQARAEAYLP